MIRHDPDQSAIHWRVDVCASAEFDSVEEGQPDWFVVGRLLADEIRRFDANEWGHSEWEVAEADSAGLEMALDSLLDENGELREFNGICDPIVYLYRFLLHDDFGAASHHVVIVRRV
jgi:hypothetical protein